MVRKIKQISFIIVVVVLSASMIRLATRNDHQFNVERNNNASEKARMERNVRTQLDSILTKQQEIAEQLDSIKIVLRETEESDYQNKQSVDQTLKRIEKADRQILKAIKKI